MNKDKIFGWFVVVFCGLILGMSVMNVLKFSSALLVYTLLGVIGGIGLIRSCSK